VLEAHRDDAASAPLPTGSLGQIIAFYRRRQHRPRRDHPLSQLDLAVASGTDQAHISRIESDRHHPEHATLVRICDALRLSPDERGHLLALAGYPTTLPLPDEQEVASALSKLAPLVDACPYPAILIDQGLRIWHLNAFVAELWGECYGATDQADCLRRVRGHRTVEMIFDLDYFDHLFPRWIAYHEDAEPLLMRKLTLFRRVCNLYPYEPGVRRLVERLKKNPQFLWRWERIERGENELLFIDHVTHTMRNPRWGRIQVDCWQSRAALDERLILCHFSPADDPTARILQRLAAALGAPPGARIG
jgi:transcriptional regulator with XRE-family HTH domain